MEIPILVLITAIGYKYSNRNKGVKNNDEPKNIFESKRAVRVLQGEQKLANKVFKEPNRMFIGSPKVSDDVLFIKPDYRNKQLPIEFNEDVKGDMYDDINATKPLVNVNETEKEPRVEYSTNYPTSGGWHGISLTGLPIEPSTFKHNNMTPFFKGNIKQNLDENAYSTVFENFTGQRENYREKVETGPLFQPQANMSSSPYGMSSISGFEQDRYIPSKIMNNIGPVEQVRVGPGLNVGVNTPASGGFQQANTRDYALPKTVDELRVLTNPKLSYYGRILAGKKGDKPGKIGVVEKHQPDSFYINSPERYFTTVGQQTAARLRPNVVLRPTHRRKTAEKTYNGPAKLAVGGKQELRSQKFRKSCKKTYSFGYRNLGKEGTWTGSTDNSFDYGKRNILRRPTERKDATADNNHIGIAYKNKKGQLRNNQPAKPTMKSTTEDNDHFGSVSASTNSYVHDPNDIAKTTLKETTIDNEYEGLITGNPRGYVKSKDDIARTTTKETTLVEDYLGQPQQPGKKGKIQNQKVRNTIRQFYNKGYTGNAGAVNGEKPQSYEAIYNSITRSIRSMIDKGFTPGMGSKLSAKFNNNINATTKKTNEIKDKYINERGLAPDRVFNSLAAPIPGSITKEASRVNNDVISDRIDASLLEPFRRCEYSHPLSSYAYS
jgi:hypothetical protein